MKLAQKVASFVLGIVLLNVLKMLPELAYFMNQIFSTVHYTALNVHK